MGFLDDAKDKIEDLAKGHGKQIDGAVDKVGDLVDDKTGDKYQGQVDKAQEFIKDKTGE